MESQPLDVLEDLPIFPLATVLFPGALLPLHIFEERYKQMMRHAIEQGGLFGLSYRKDAEVGRETPPEVGSVGCVARVNAVMPLEEGRLNLVATGQVRYRVVALTQLAPFLIARVETFNDYLEVDEEVQRLQQEVADLGRKYLEAADLSQELPDEAEALSLLLAAALPADNDVKQDLLEMTSTRARLMRLRRYLAAALTAHLKRATMQERARRNGHGEMKIRESDA